MAFQSRTEKKSERFGKLRVSRINLHDSVYISLGKALGFWDRIVHTNRHFFFFSPLGKCVIASNGGRCRVVRPSADRVIQRDATTLQVTDGSSRAGS